MARERWRLVAAVAVQLAVLALVPARQLLAGMHGTNICSSTPMPEAAGATHMIELSVAVMTPVMVLVTVVAAVALARME